MKDILIKILSHLSKNALAAIVVTLALFIGMDKAKRFTEKQDAIKSVLIEVKTGQSTLHTNMEDGFRASENRDVQLKLEQAKTQGQIDLITKSLPKIKQDQINQYNQLYQQIRDQQQETKDEGFIPNTIKSKVPEFTTQIPQIEGKKKLIE